MRGLKLKIPTLKFLSTSEEGIHQFFFSRYCDVFQRCREVDPSGPLATLRKLLLSDESIAGFKRWVLTHWYAVLLILLAVIALLVSSKHITVDFLQFLSTVLI